MDPFSIAILAMSAFAKMQANEEAADRREAFRRSMEQYQRTKAAEVEQATDTLIKKQTPEARASELSDITVDRERSLRNTVGAAQAFDAPEIGGKLSADYRSTQEADAARIAERTRRAIEQLSTIGAPGEQAQAFGLRFGKAAGDVDAANAASRSVGGGYLRDIEGVEPDPFMTMLGDVGMAAGSAMLGQSLSVPKDTIAWTGQGDPSAFDIEDAAMAGKTLRKATVSERLRHGLGLWGAR